MASIRTYALIYVALLLLGTAKFVLFVFEDQPLLTYEVAATVTLALAVTKATLIAGWYQHLREEPRSVTYLMATALFMVFLLTLAAGYSIQ